MRNELTTWLERISRLALIKVRDDEREIVIRDMGKIIEFFNSINELDLSNVEPLFMVLNEKPVLREDVARGGLDVNEVLLNVKESENGFIKGPKTA
ncbi:MAG: Asp-tRNA(Asn)/Glu-tRNA(Gln) amidotransferase subunit GatC [Sulfolobales archaeon]|nr:Asp-tRNA(Asn)/Glu-tRNA(Gln) amidotransferase subunit GatC [Sulfolobales archaeon]MCX8186371.1 Asp-tRNA(Asn)/Glu-tRNA(Gln) amidotransferase subunit GatC [Sulfolobales archaeon]MDW7968894.1 Asp-tRNA(Asn)/Glu-tRNA(Gln) amidotransferase subunit GatC [Sulfolobales archaeon]